MKRLALGLCAAAAVGLAASCIIAYVDSPGYGTDGDLFSYRKSTAFSPGGTLAVVNTNGQIRVRGWDEARLEVRAGAPAPRRDARRFRVDGFDSVLPDIRFRLDGDEVKIQCPDDAERDSVYDFEIRVPRSIRVEGIRNGEGRVVVSDIYGRLEVEAERGEVIVENFSGDLDLTLETGEVRAEVLDMRGEDEVRVEVEDGDIEILLQEPVGAALVAEAKDGEVSSEIALGASLPAPKLELKPERANGRIVLKTGRGDIRIRKAAGAGRGD